MRHVSLLPIDIINSSNEENNEEIIYSVETHDNTSNIEINDNSFVNLQSAISTNLSDNNSNNEKVNNVIRPKTKQRIKSIIENTNISIPKIELKNYRSGCYLIQRQTDSIYKRVKIGQSEDLMKRLKGESSYKNCVILSTQHVDLNKILLCENEIINTFTKEFKLINEAEEGNCGNETFEVNDLFKAIKLFNEICYKYFI